jgi:hypothetical protein
MVILAGSAPIIWICARWALRRGECATGLVIRGQAMIAIDVVVARSEMSFCERTWRSIGTARLLVTLA